ncbi:MAG: TSUP family transporter, partial [Myxococcota bacterium]|nr:TSUP family transporter [Myxococcota bacterium]
MLLEPQDAGLVAPALVCLAAALFQRLTGFGFSLVATSALGLLWPLRQVVVLLALPAVCASGAAFLQVRRDLQLGRVRAYAAWMLGTVPLGVIGLRWLPLPILKAALVVQLATSLLGRRMPHAVRILQWTPLSGIVAGLASGALGTPGVAVVGWVHSQDLTLAQQRAASLLLFTLAGLLRLPLYLLYL